MKDVNRSARFWFPFHIYCPDMTLLILFGGITQVKIFFPCWSQPCLTHPQFHIGERSTHCAKDRKKFWNIKTDKKKKLEVSVAAKSTHNGELKWAVTFSKTCISTANCHRISDVNISEGNKSSFNNSCADEESQSWQCNVMNLVSVNNANYAVNAAFVWRGVRWICYFWYF